jgi:hypothetical protein
MLIPGIIKPSFQLLSVPGSLTGIKRDPPGILKIIILIPGDDVKMIMPDVLVTSGLIVLANCNAITPVCRFHRQCHIPGQELNLPGKQRR